MPSTRDIRRRIKSVKSTQQITKAMQMVASAKMRRSQQAALASRPYARLLYRIQRDATTHAGDFTHPMLEKREVRRRAVVLVSSDKGMCGALNSNLFAKPRAWTGSPRFSSPPAGRPRSLSRARSANLRRVRLQGRPAVQGGAGHCENAADLFVKREVDQVDIYFNRSSIPSVKNRSRLNFCPSRRSPAWRPPEEPASREAPEHAPEFLFEPNAGAVLGALLPHYLNLFLYQVLLEAKASEQSARWSPMKTPPITPIRSSKT